MSLNFKTSTSKCGIRVVRKPDNRPEMQMYLYVRYDSASPYTSYDERISVRCSPQEILLSGSMGRNEPLHPPAVVSELKAVSSSVVAADVKDSIQSSPITLVKAHPDNNRISIKPLGLSQFTSSVAKDGVAQQIDCHMDVMRGRIPFLKPIDAFVDIGDDVTILVKMNNVRKFASLSLSFEHVTCEYRLTWIQICVASDVGKEARPEVHIQTTDTICGTERFLCFS